MCAFTSKFEQMRHQKTTRTTEGFQTQVKKIHILSIWPNLGCFWTTNHSGHFVDSFSIIFNVSNVALPAGKPMLCMKKNEWLPDQEVEGDGTGLLWKVMLKNSAVHLQPLTLTTAKESRSIRRLFSANVHTRKCSHCFKKKRGICNLRTCHQKMQVRRILSLWGWSGRIPSRGARTTAASAVMGRFILRHLEF